jgi:ferredoxin-like protein FixX
MREAEAALESSTFKVTTWHKHLNENVDEKLEMLKHKCTSALKPIRLYFGLARMRRRSSFFVLIAACTACSTCSGATPELMLGAACREVCTDA